MQGQLGSLYETEIIVSPRPLIDWISPGYTVLQHQRNPLFFWEPLPKAEKKKYHYSLVYGNKIMVDQITFSQIKKDLNKRTMEDPKWKIAGGKLMKHECNSIVSLSSCLS